MNERTDQRRKKRWFTFLGRSHETGKKSWAEPSEYVSFRESNVGPTFAVVPHLGPSTDNDETYREKEN